MDYVSLGRRIQAVRNQRRFTQEQLAEKAGISASFLGHIERGDRAASLDTLMELCSALSVTPNDLLDIEQKERDDMNRIAVLARELLQYIEALPEAWNEEN